MQTADPVAEPAVDGRPLQPIRGPGGPRDLGSAAVQLAVVRGARVIGTASPANHDYLRSLGAEPVAYGEGLVERVRALAPGGVDLALDVAGSGVLPALVDLQVGLAAMPTVHQFDDVAANAVKLADAFRARKLPVVLVNVAGGAPAAPSRALAGASFPTAGPACSPS